MVGNSSRPSRWVAILEDGRTPSGISNKAQIPEKRADKDKISSRGSVLEFKEGFKC